MFVFKKGCIVKAVSSWTGPIRDESCVADLKNALAAKLRELQSFSGLVGGYAMLHTDFSRLKSTIDTFFGGMRGLLMLTQNLHDLPTIFEEICFDAEVLKEQSTVLKSGVFERTAHARIELVRVKGFSPELDCGNLEPTATHLESKNFHCSSESVFKDVRKFGSDVSSARMAVSGEAKSMTKRKVPITEL